MDLFLFGSPNPAVGGSVFLERRQLGSGALSASCLLLFEMLPGISREWQWLGSGIHAPGDSVLWRVHPNHQAEDP